MMVTASKGQMPFQHDELARKILISMRSESELSLQRGTRSLMLILCLVPTGDIHAANTIRQDWVKLGDQVRHAFNR